MKLKLIQALIKSGLFVWMLFSFTATGEAQFVFTTNGSAFTYQGQLRDNGVNANGTYTIIFKLYDAASAGNQIGPTITNTPTIVNGIFTVNLDFGYSFFDNVLRWLDITVSFGGVTQTLAPRVQVLPAPVAQMALAAASLHVTETCYAFTNTLISSDTWDVGLLPSITHHLLFMDNGITKFTIQTNGNIISTGTNFGNGWGLTNVSTVPNLQVFAQTNATFVVPANVTRIMVEMWGAGGGGGRGYRNANLNTSFGGGGGGAGAYAMNVFSVTPGASFAVTAPFPTLGGQSGGSASFGSLMSAGGGLAGSDATDSADGVGGAGGNPSGGILQLRGDSGGVLSGGAIWRGSAGNGASGPGGGGEGVTSPTQGPSGPGFGGNFGAVIVYY